jgi:hypothetical protein
MVRSTAAAPLTRQKGAAPTRAGGNDRRFLLFDPTFDLLLALTIIPFLRLIQWNPSPVYGFFVLKAVSFLSTGYLCVRCV